MLTRNQMRMLFSFSTHHKNVNLCKNYYKILQVDIKCDQKSIKKSYLQLVKKLHPDINPNGKQKFTEVQQAYQILSDLNTKKYYDQNRQYIHSSKMANNNHGYNHDSKSYYDYQYNQYSQNNQNGNNEGYAYGNRYSTQKEDDKSGHKYYTHRKYESQNYQDYFYHEKSTKFSAKSSQNQDEQQFVQQKQNKRQKNYNSQADWDQYKRQSKQRQNQRYKNESQEQRKMRERLREMRGFTSSYNVMWNRGHLRYKQLMNEEARVDKNKKIIQEMIPQKVKRFYDKVMKRIEKKVIGEE